MRARKYTEFILLKHRKKNLKNKNACFGETELHVLCQFTVVASFSENTRKIKFRELSYIALAFVKYLRIFFFSLTFSNLLFLFFSY